MAYTARTGPQFTPRCQSATAHAKPDASNHKVTFPVTRLCCNGNTSTLWQAQKGNADMTRQTIPLHTPDVSRFAKTLKSLVDERHASGKPLPGHAEWMNLLARCAGQRNFATLKAAALKAAPVVAPPALAPLKGGPASLEGLSPTARKALTQFDEALRLARLPNKLSVQQMCMWALWTRFDARRKYTEKEVNAIINAAHSFGDQATLQHALQLARGSAVPMADRRTTPAITPVVPTHAVAA